MSPTFVVDFAVAVLVGSFDHCFDVILADVFAEVLHGGPQLLLVDDPVAVAVEHPERLPHLVLLAPLRLLGVPRPRPRHEAGKRVEVQTTFYH